jgi:hypothetical protein
MEIYDSTVFDQNACNTHGDEISWMMFGKRQKCLTMIDKLLIFTT